MREKQNQIAVCKREIDDCQCLLKTSLQPNDRIALLRRLEQAEQQLREIEDEILLSLME